MAPLNHVSDSNLVATVAAAISVLGHHTHTEGKFPRREFGAAYLQATEDARSGQRRDMAGPELETLFHTLEYRGLCFPSAFTTIDGETELGVVVTTNGLKRRLGEKLKRGEQKRARLRGSSHRDCA